MTNIQEAFEAWWWKDRKKVPNHPDTEFSKYSFEAGYQAAPVIPAGWVMVPEEPTAEMCEAAEGQWMVGSNVDMAKREYKAMLAAAPKGEGK